MTRKQYMIKEFGQEAVQVLDDTGGGELILASRTDGTARLLLSKWSGQGTEEKEVPANVFQAVMNTKVMTKWTNRLPEGSISGWSEILTGEPRAEFVSYWRHIQ